ncbi:MAG: response regulator [Planctomycetota bacterium]
MLVLLVEDEPGIREGLAAFLRIKGHIVRLAETCASGLAAARDEVFDAVITDWRLGDGTGDQVVRASDCPAVVMSGYPEEVTGLGDAVTVLRKPVTPATLLQQLEQLVPPQASASQSQAAQTPMPQSQASPHGTAVDDLPIDVRDRVALALALAGYPEEARITVDGGLVTLAAPLVDTRDEDLTALEAVGGDLRVLEPDGQPWLELQLDAAGRPEGETVVQPGEPWPPALEAVVVDFRGCDRFDPDEFLALTDRAHAAERDGRVVRFINVPSHLRLYAELLDQAHRVPKRPKSGPRLPEVLQELWRLP